MSDNWRSRIITQGEARSPNRAMLRAVGFGDGDFDKAIVGVANGHSTMNPCNAGIQPLRSEEHTSELQSQSNLVCRLLLEKKKAHALPARQQAIDPVAQTI